MSGQLTLIARVQAKPGQQARLGRELKVLVGPTLAEPGCIGYDLHESKTEPGLFLFYETWKSDADLDAHFQMPHMAAFMAKLPELIEGSIDLTKWTKL